MDALITTFNLAWIYYYDERYDDALPMFESAEAGFTERLGAEHMNVLAAKRARGTVLRKQERYDESIDMLD